MRIRHKPPTLVSMWMLDVFCCALGCVTLLWLMNTRDAKDQAQRAGVALELLNRTESELKSRQTELLATKADLDQTRRKLNADIEELRGKYLVLATQKADLAKKLTVTETQLVTATQSTAAMAQLLQQRERERDELAIKAKKADDQLIDLDAKLKAVTKEAQDATANLATMRKTGDDLAAARATLRDLQKKIDDSNASIIDLQGDKAKLADKFERLRTESETRFAGIAMTGKRVVFVVDTSGSMKLVDDKTPAPQKWPTVVETVAKVMRSLPDLEKFQVVTFSRKADYVLGSGEWLGYTGEASVKQVTDALKRLDPAGDTNLYDALDLAFRLKSSGLDTVYLFSDGLPTSGAGLAPSEEKTLTDAQKSERLTKHIRQTLAATWNPPGARRVRINSIGFFFESPEVGAFLWMLSRDNDGSFVGMSRP